MDVASRLIFEFMILVVCSVSPGLMVVRRSQLGPLESLCLTIGLSWVVIYLAVTGIYLAHLGTAWHFLLTGACLIGLVFSAPQLARLWRHKSVRLALAGFAFLLIWHMLLLSLVRTYSGGDWCNDWYEHYERALFFVNYLPKDTRFLNIYDLPARPPMMNLICGHILAQVGTRFDLYQPAMLFLNLLVYFPCVLITNLIARRGRRQLLLIVIFLAASPIFTQNVTYTWTKLLTAFYVILGIWLYVRGWRKQDARRMIAAFVALAAGFLVHYSAGPYIVFIGLHYAVIVWRRRRPAVELLGSATLAGLLLLSWFGWSFWIYGVNRTISTNTTVADSRSYSGMENLRKMGGNLFDTLMPHPLHVSWRDFEICFYQPSALGYLRDYWFMMYQRSLFPGMGLLGGMIIVMLLLRGVTASPAPGMNRPAKSIRVFWLGMAVFCTIVGVAVHGSRLAFGVSSICLQSLMLLGIIFLAANFPLLPRPMRWAVAMGLVVDFCLGVFLEFHVQRLAFFPQPIGSIQLIPLTDRLINRTALSDSVPRRLQQLSLWGDHFAGAQTFLQAAMAVIFLILLFPVARTVAGPSSRWSGTLHGQARFSCRWPTAPFYALAITLLAGIAWCGHDEFSGAHPIGPDILPNIAADPDSSPIHRAAGEALYHRGDINGAIDHLAEAYILDPLSFQAHYELMLSLAQTTLYKPEARRCLGAADAVVVEPESAPAQVNLSVVLASHHHVASALACAMQAVKLDDNSAIAHYAVGALCDESYAERQNEDRGRLDQAIQELSIAVRLRPDYPQAWSALRASLKSRGDSPTEVDAFVARLKGTLQ